MNVTWQTAAQLSARCGFSRTVLLPAKRVAAYVPNDEAEKRGIVSDPAALLEGAESVLVAAMTFAWYLPWPDGHAEVSAFYFHSQRAHMAIRTLGEALSARGARVSVDQSLPQKLLGRNAGFGLLGRNSLLRNAAWGSCFTLRVLVADIPPQPQPEAMPAPVCGECRRCVEACPTGALDGEGNLDTVRCLRSHMMRGEVVPEALRAHMGNRLLGCEICQRVCPHNAGIPEEAPDASAFLTDTLLRGDRRDLDELARHIGWNEARLQRVQAQAALVAGNSGDARHLSALKTLNDHERSAVAAHARWAIEQLEGERPC